jgi:hypothetical protein
MIIKPTSLTISQLLGATNEQYVIPAYQRRYSWREKQLWELLEDISLIEGSDTHLLGSIVCLTGYHSAGINALEVVDGQQRLTTISILLHCIHERLVKEGESGEAQNVERLLQARALGSHPVRKIALDSIDSSEFDQNAAGKPPEKPDNANLASAFSLFREWVAQRKLPEVGTFLYRLQNQAIVIRLDVSAAKDAFKLFETINNRGLRLSPTDIIKNFILGNAARFGEKNLKYARQKWFELLQHLDGTSIDVFFRQFLMARMKKRVRVSDVIPNFKTLVMKNVKEAKELPERHWYSDDEEPVEDPEESDVPEEELLEIQPSDTQISFEEFLDDLIICAKVYGEIAKATTGQPQIDRRLKNLRMIKSLQTYSFLMHLRAGGCSTDNFEKVLQLTEAFMLRRHICRGRSNENESAFAKLCSVDSGNPLPEVIETFKQYCFPDDRFKEDFAKAEFNATLIDRARYCLEQFEYLKQGKYPELVVGGTDNVHVEHIIPQKIKTQKAKTEFGDWPSYLGSKAEALHPNFVSRIGNLTLFAGELNIGASNNPYERKKIAYKESAIKLTNTLPSEYPEFRFDAIETRSADFAAAAVQIWPFPQ